MKHIQESIIGRKGSKHWYELHNPELKDLQHLDVVKCANSNIYICIDPDRLREPIDIKNFDCYRINRIIHPTVYVVSKLGLINYYQNLVCKISKEYDIVAVYRDVFINNKDYPNFQVIWDILQEKMKKIAL